MGLLSEDPYRLQLVCPPRGAEEGVKSGGHDHEGEEPLVVGGGSSLLRDSCVLQQQLG
jgi:hypothetical protein